MKTPQKNIRLAASRIERDNNLKVNSGFMKYLFLSIFKVTFDILLQAGLAITNYALDSMCP